MSKSVKRKSKSRVVKPTAQGPLGRTGKGPGRGTAAPRAARAGAASPLRAVHGPRDETAGGNRSARGIGRPIRRERGDRRVWPQAAKRDVPGRCVEARARRRHPVGQ